MLLSWTSSSQNFTRPYADNDTRGTIVRRITDEERRDIELTLLNLLDLPGRPSKTTANARQSSAIKFMMDIYRGAFSRSDRIFEEQYPTISNATEKFELTARDVRAVDMSDVVRAFAAHPSRSGESRYYDDVERIWFNVTEVPRYERIVTAELRVYREAKKKSDVARDDDRGALCVISVHREIWTKHERYAWRYLDSVEVTATTEGWITLDVGRAVEQWINHSEKNRGLLLSVRRRDGRDDIGGIVGVAGIPDRRPFLIGFFDTAAGAAARRWTNDRGRPRRDLRANDSRKRLSRMDTSECHVSNFFVSFKELQWDDWIIAPNGYDIRVCSGLCRFPFRDRMNTTNHSIIQSLLHVLYPATIPSPSCAPTKLSPVSLIYVEDENNVVVLKKFKDMIIDSCGCL